MIAPGAGVRVYLACGVTDMRKGIAGLAAHAQLAMLWEGIDWRRPAWSSPPARVV
jgi:transposase